VRGFIAFNLEKEIGFESGRSRHAVAARRSKLGLDRRRQTAEKTSRQARVVAEHDPAGMSAIRHGLDIASRSG
jgi:hypothetical protein